MKSKKQVSQHIIYRWFIVFITTYGQTVTACTIVREPSKTTVVSKVNETLEFTCELVYPTGSFLQMVFDGQHAVTYGSNPNEGSAKFLQERGIKWSCESETKCNISINATTENNGTTLHCTSLECPKTEDPKTKYKIIVVNGIPSAPGPPDIAILDQTTLNISWSPPWLHPVLSYRLMIHNSITNTTIFKDTENTSYSFKKENETECATIEFSVLAVTDIGSTTFSRVSSKGFPLSDSKFTESLQNKTMIMHINKTDCGMTSTLKLTGMAPRTCPYETLRYTFSVSSSTTKIKPVIFMPNESIPEVFFEHIQGTRKYNVNVTINIDDWQIQSYADTIDVPEVSETPFHGYWINHPKTKVVFINNRAEFSCFGNYTNSYPPLLKINDKDVNILNAGQMGIEWQSRTLPPYGGYNVSVNATVTNNETTVQCFLYPCISEKAKLIVANSLPNVIDPPVVTTINRTSLNISWNLPWFHPVNFYTVFVHNLTERQNSSLSYTTKTNFFIFNNEEMFECAELSFAVQADTDVGENAVSNSTIKRFYKGILGINIINSTWSYQFEQDMERLTTLLRISFDPPPVCSYEVLSYTFKLTNLRSKEVLTKTVHNQSNVEFNLYGKIVADDELDLVLSVAVFNEEEEHEATINLTTYNSIVFTVQVPTSKNLPFDIVIWVVCAAGGLITLLVMLILCFWCLYCYRKIAERHKVRSDGTRSAADQIHFTLPHMIPNAQYVTSDEIMYETIPSTLEEVAAFQNGLHKGSYSTTVQDNNIAPQLPPRPAIGVSANVKHVNAPFGLTLKEDEYIEMGANPTNLSPRYIQSPLKHFNATDQSNCKSVESKEINTSQSIKMYNTVL